MKLYLVYIKHIQDCDISNEKVFSNANTALGYANTLADNLIATNYAPIDDDSPYFSSISDWWCCKRFEDRYNDAEIIVTTIEYVNN